MTDTELSLAIATFLEPKPESKHCYETSDGDAWYWEHGKWQPRAVYDTELTVELLKKLMEHRSEGGHVLFMNDGGFTLDGLGPWSPDIFQRAVAVTFARAHGLWKD